MRAPSVEANADGRRTPARSHVPALRLHRRTRPSAREGRGVPGAMSLAGRGSFFSMIFILSERRIFRVRFETLEIHQGGGWELDDRLVQRGIQRSQTLGFADFRFCWWGGCRCLRRRGRRDGRSSIRRGGGLLLLFRCHSDRLSDWNGRIVESLHAWANRLIDIVEAKKGGSDNRHRTDRREVHRCRRAGPLCFLVFLRLISHYSSVDVAKDFRNFGFGDKLLVGKGEGAGNRSRRVR